jgi:hypothetical protein
MIEREVGGNDRAGIDSGGMSAAQATAEARRSHDIS